MYGGDRTECLVLNGHVWLFGGLTCPRRARLGSPAGGIFLAADTAQGQGGYGWGLDLVVASPSGTGSW